MVILYLIVILLSFPTGYVLAYMARDELIAGRKWFIILAISCIIIAGILSMIRAQYKLPMILTLLFIVIISLVAVWKSYDKKFIKK